MYINQMAYETCGGISKLNTIIKQRIVLTDRNVVTGNFIDFYGYSFAS